MTEPSRHRYLIQFEKTAAMRYTGHLDLYRTWERTLRRAGLPLAYSEGFTPHPRLSLAAALPLGCTSEAELAEVWLDGDLDPGAVKEALQRAEPPGLRVLHVGCLPADAPALQNQVVGVEYDVSLREAANPVELAHRITALLQASSLPRERRGKAYDLRPLIEQLEAVPAEPGKARLWMRLAAREGASGRPDEVLLALGFDPAAARIHRRHLVLATNSSQDC
ncbi:MAG: TIGR03936 family radical SAM-associated protein [Chloroflexota bacterium]